MWEGGRTQRNGNFINDYSEENDLVFILHRKGYGNFSHTEASSTVGKNCKVNDRWPVKHRVTECSAVMLFWGSEDPANNVDKHEGFTRSKFSKRFAQ